jgi:lysozyme
MKLDENGYKFIRGFEGWSSKPYLDSVGVPTIGFGNTFYPSGRKVTMSDKSITLSEGIVLNKFVADMFAKDVTSLLKQSVNQNRFNAIVDFAYNLGSDIDADNIAEGLGDSTLLKKINANPNDITIAAEFLKWNKARGKVLNGLTTRRQAEVKLYFKPID